MQINSKTINKSIIQSVMQLKESIIKDSMFRNSFFLMLNTALLAMFGFVFWILAARFYEAKYIGITSSLISAASLISSFAILGFDNSFMKYLPKSKNVEEQISSSLTIAAFASVILSIPYLAFVGKAAPELGFLASSNLLILAFNVFIIVNTLNNLTNFIFVALRASKYVLIINLGFGLIRVVMLAALIRYGLYGVISSHVIAVAYALMITMLFLKRFINYKFRLKVNVKIVREMGKYAGGSYLSSILSALPGLILPTVILSMLGAEQSGYYYMVAVVISIINIIPQAVSQSLFAESVWDEAKMKHNIMRAIRLIYALITPIIFLVILLGDKFLNVFGSSYSKNGYETLLILSLACLPRVICIVLGTVLRIENRIILLSKVLFLYAALVIGGSVYGLNVGWGLKSVAISTLFAELTISFVYVITLYKRSLFTR